MKTPCTTCGGSGSVPTMFKGSSVTVQSCQTCNGTGWMDTTPTPCYPQGWECPRCHKIHSPFVPGCSCDPQVYTYTAPLPGIIYRTPTDKDFDGEKFDPFTVDEVGKTTKP